MARKPQRTLVRSVKSADPVLAAHNWKSNAELIIDLRKLGYIGFRDEVLDPTYGKGNWWKKWKPPHFTGSDINPDKSPVGYSVDFTNMPWEDESFDVVTFDPPYIAQGGRTTSGIQHFLDSFGLHDVPRTPEECQQLINDGITEAWRVLRSEGRLMVKCKDYVNGGRLWHGTHYTLTHLMDTGFIVEDRLEHISGLGPQPKRSRQLHARRNFSTMFVATKPKEKK